VNFGDLPLNLVMIAIFLGVAFPVHEFAHAFVAYVRGDAAARPHAGTPFEVDLWGERINATAWDRWPPKA